MPVIDGRVACVLVGDDDFGFTMINDNATSPPTPTARVLWSVPGGIVPPLAIREMWLSLLRDAMSNNTEVAVGSDTATPSTATSVQLPQ